MYLARALTVLESVIILSRRNIGKHPSQRLPSNIIFMTMSAALRAQQVDVTANKDMILEFPQSEDLVNFSVPLGGMEPASIRIPAALLRERARNGMLTDTCAC